MGLSDVPKRVRLRAQIPFAAMPDLRTRRILRLIAENQGVDLSEKKKSPDSPVLDAWNEETQSWEPADEG